MSTDWEAEEKEFREAMSELGIDSAIYESSVYLTLPDGRQFVVLNDCYALEHGLRVERNEYI